MSVKTALITTWEDVKSDLRRQVGDDTYTSWIEPLDFKSIKGGVVTLSAPNRFFATRVETSLDDRIQAAWRKTDPAVRRIAYKVGRKATATGNDNIAKQPATSANRVLAEEEAASSIGKGRKPRAKPRAAEKTAKTRKTNKAASTANESAEGEAQAPKRSSRRTAKSVTTPELGVIPATARSEQEASPMKSIKVSDRLHFDNFVVGRPNEFAFAAAKRVSEAETTPFNPLFLHGGVGLGKTHLLHAIARRRQELYPHEKILFVSAESFLLEFVSALRHHDMVTFKEMFRSVDMLIVDDVQHIMGKHRTQEEFFHTFNALADDRRQIVLSADSSPSDLENVDERLRSRLGWGLVADLHPTDYELRLGILETKTEEAMRLTPDLEVDPKVLDFLAHRISANVRVLEGALIRLFAHASMAKRPATIEMAQRVLEDLLKKSNRKVSIEEIQRKVAEHFNIRMADMHSARRARSVARPRQIAMYLAKQLTQKSLPDIGEKFGGRDHSTVIHAVKRVTELRTLDSAFDDDVERLRRALEG
ncbi:MAG: chromosomal replication initiator protein DnaA [Rhodobacteraceae bacterium]|nr:chromosomal replication initiator protein DnaA [Paracoccaceae bacterium]